MLFNFYTFVIVIDSNKIFNIKSNSEFEVLAFQIFRHQFDNNSVYRSFCDLLYKNPSDISAIKDIPFLPIQFFKSHKIVSSDKDVEQVFTSSGTTGSVTSRHHVDRSKHL